MAMLATIVWLLAGTGDGVWPSRGVHLTGDSRWWPPVLREPVREHDWLVPLPPIGWIGSYHDGDESAAGLLSPWLSAGHVEFSTPLVRGTLSGVDVPLLGITPWHAVTIGDDHGAAWSEQAVLEWSIPWHRKHPCELFSLVRLTTAGDEWDLRLASILGSSLVRVQRDMPASLLDPDLDRFPRGLLLNRGVDALRESERKVAEVATVDAPITQRVTALGPMFRYEQRGAQHELALRPLFVWDSERGFSLPWAALTIGGSDQGFPSREAVSHLFPLVSRGANRSHHDVLWPLASVHDDAHLTIVDLKFLFQVQSHDERGAMLGVLPFPFGGHPHDAFTRDFPQYHLGGHLLSWWHLDGEVHFSLAAPFLFRYHDQSAREHHALHELDFGPFGFLYRERADESTLQSSSLFSLLHRHEEKTDGRDDTEFGPLGTILQVHGTTRGREYRAVTVPFLQASLLRVNTRGADRDVELLPAPFLSLLQYHADEDASEFSLGPFSCLLDLSFGPDRFAWSLTPLIKFERLGDSRRLRLLFMDAYASGVFAEQPGDAAED